MDKSVFAFKNVVLFVLQNNKTKVEKWYKINGEPF